METDNIVFFMYTDGTILVNRSSPWPPYKVCTDFCFYWIFLLFVRKRVLFLLEKTLLTCLQFLYEGILYPYLIGRGGGESRESREALLMISKTVHSINFGRALELSPKGKKILKS